MVVKIQPPAPNIEAAMEYNNRKMSGKDGIMPAEDEISYANDGETGHILVTRNVPEGSTLASEFERLKKENRKTLGRKLENQVFHMSINPGEDDEPMDESRIVEFTDELMKELGYADVPYRIFRHDDTGRTHYHVVATRIGQDGKKIKDSFENARCEKICRSLEEKYGYSYGLPDESKSKDKGIKQPNETVEGTSEQTRTKKPFVAPFDAGSKDAATVQLRRIHEEAMKWSFTTPEQYGLLMRKRFNVEAEVYPDGMHLTGLDKDMDARVHLTETQIGMNILQDVLRKCDATKMSAKKAQRERLEKTARQIAEQSESWKDFVRNMHKKGVITAISFTEDGKPFGVTWLDRATRCAFKGSETNVTLQWIQTTAEEKGWKILPPIGKPARTSLTAAETRLNRKKKDARTLEHWTKPDNLNHLMRIRGVKRSEGSNRDASKDKDDIKYGDERQDNDIII